MRERFARNILLGEDAELADEDSGQTAEGDGQAEGSVAFLESTEEIELF